MGDLSCQTKKSKLPDPRKGHFLKLEQNIRRRNSNFYTRTMMVRSTAIFLLAVAMSYSDAKIHEINGVLRGDQGDRRNQEHTGGRGRRRRPGRGNGGVFGGKLNFTPMGSLPIESESVQQLAEEHGSAAVEQLLSFLEGGLASPKASLDLAISTWKDNLEASKQDCSSQQVDLPSCSWNLRGEPGTWVCRSLYNPVTGERESRNACVHPEFSFSAIDTCGACVSDESSATPSTIAICTCACTSTRGESGVGISVFGGVIELCYPEAMSNTAVNTFDFVSCGECI